MDVISLLIAVSLSMFLFSTLSSMLVELFNRIRDKRNIQLRTMLNEFYQQELLPLAKNSVVEGADNFIARVDKNNNKERVDTNEFIRRVAETDIGQKISSQLNSEVDDLIAEMALRFEEMGDRYREFYRKDAALVNLLCSVLIALVLNINLITIMQSIHANPKVLAALVEKAEALEKVQQSATATQAQKFAQQLKDDTKQLRLKINKLGIPYGWPTKSFRDPQLSFLQQLKNSLSQGVSSLGVILWFITTLITGLLIGLGGPFWFDIMKRLLSVNRFATAIFTTTKVVKKNNEEEVLSPQVVFRNAIKGAVAMKNLTQQQHAPPINSIIKL